MRYPILTLFLLIILYSCKNTDVKVIHDDLVVLNPDINEIKKGYYKYSTFNPSYPDYYLYSPIGPSRKEKGKAKSLIPEFDHFDYRIFYKYIKNNFNGQYEAYLVNNNTILYRDYVEIYKDEKERKFKALQDFENYFKQKKISFKVHKQKYFEDDGGTRFVFLLKKNDLKTDSVYFSVFLTKEKMEASLFYNIKDTINAFPWISTTPYRGQKIED
ncbi:hypothetical protein EG339_06600 [Chryseobacterium bernardetii]|uniref:Lipoprotein n=1 Tax=Chryseobacterium bernardetii TaxID=1241978 RepID=A0A3G6T4L4_9FLAO|nr:hypothetical protein [Chryseobacterium bernardetii]AZB24301.1 hypothetical protein EG339_06600 [Chryseobacterium bernardetii]